MEGRADRISFVFLIVHYSAFVLYKSKVQTLVHGVYTASCRKHQSGDGIDLTVVLTDSDLSFFLLSVLFHINALTS